MKIAIIKRPLEGEWMVCKLVALGTMGKEPQTPPSADWKHNILKARHSPIRTLQFLFKLEDIPYYVSVHLCRHVHATPFVQTQRTDRTGEERGSKRQDAPVTMYWYMNAEELMVIANKRLCNKADKATQQVVAAMCAAVLKECPEFAGLLVPSCMAHGGVCDEMQPCGQMGKEKPRAEPPRGQWEEAARYEG